MIIGETVVTQADYRVVVKALLAPAMRMLRVFGIVLAVLGLPILLLAKHYSDYAVGVLALALAVILIVWMPVRARSLSVRRTAPALDAPWRFEVGDEGVTMTNPVARTFWPWTSLLKVTEHPTFWQLATPIRNQYVIIVRTAFREPDQVAVADLIRRKVGPALTA